MKKGYLYCKWDHSDVTLNNLLLCFIGSKDMSVKS